MAEVDAAAITANCRRLNRALGKGTVLCAVVKADGYGHGAVLGAAAALAGGASRLAVSTAPEAGAIRASFPRIPTLALGILSMAEVDQVLSCGAELGCSSAEELDLIETRARALGARAEIHLKFDSGMGRLGTSSTVEILAMASRCSEAPGLRLSGVWTHFASADDRHSGQFDAQLDSFEAIAREVRSISPTAVIHAANSAAVLRDVRSHFDMARCGVALYGLDPFQSDPRPWDLVPAMSLHSRVGPIREIRPGGGVGYGPSWRAGRWSRVGVVPIGYGDGVRRALSNVARVLVGGESVPVVGTISMDSLTVDLTSVPWVARGDRVTILGDQGAHRVLAEELARHLGTINYEITCGVSKRVPRIARRDR